MTVQNVFTLLIIIDKYWRRSPNQVRHIRGIWHVTNCLIGGHSPGLRGPDQHTSRRWSTCTCKLEVLYSQLQQQIKAISLKIYRGVIPITEASLGGDFIRGNFTYTARLTCFSLYSSSASAKAVLCWYQT